MSPRRMGGAVRFWIGTVGVAAAVCAGWARAAQQQDFSPPPDERQLPYAMRSAMDETPRITVGARDADIMGGDNRALQAAVDYVAGLGGGLVEIRPGRYLMRDSLHLRSNVTVRGEAGKTILVKAPAAVSPLALDGDFGEEQITVRDPTGFDVGSGVAVFGKGASGFHATVARIIGRRGPTLAIDRPLMSDCMVRDGVQAATVYPVVSGCNVRDVRVEGLVIEGAKESNVPLNGCRGAGVYFYRAFGGVIQDCVVRNYNGDGISFQQSNDVQVLRCVSESNANLGIHPGSGSQRPVVRGCVARGNGADGLYLCWRVRHGLFENNVLERNGRYGISIGHKDSDNVLRNNQVRENAHEGVYFRNESLGMAPHRNRLENNLIENNGAAAEAPGIRIRGEVNGLVFRGNTIRDTRPAGSQTQTVGVLIEAAVGDVVLEDNTIQAPTPVEDRRGRAG